MFFILGRFRTGRTVLEKILSEVGVSDLEIFKKATELLNKGESFAICTVIEKRGFAPREPGAKMIVLSNGERHGTIGGWSVEKFIVKKALEVFKKGKPSVVELMLTDKTRKKTGLVCGGVIKVFVDVVKPKPKLIIFGGSYVGKSIAKIGALSGFEVTVIDEEESIGKEEIPFATIKHENYSQASQEIPEGEEVFIAITLGEVEPSKEILRNILRKNVRYIGMLGSKHKAKVVFSELRNEGFTEEALERIRAPMGLDINAETPEEIAVSTMAEIIKERRK